MKLKPSDLLWMRYNAPTHQNGSSVTPPTEPVTPPTNADNGVTPGTQTGTQEETVPKSKVNEIVEERLKRERDKQTQDRLKADQKYKELSESQQKDLERVTNEHQTATQEIDALKGKVTAYEQVINELVKTQRKGIPAPIIKLLDKMSPLDQLAWLADDTNKSVIGSSRGGVPPSPKPGGDDSAKGSTALERWQQRNKVEAK